MSRSQSVSLCSTCMCKSHSSRPGGMSFSVLAPREFFPACSSAIRRDKYCQAHKQKKSHIEKHGVYVIHWLSPFVSPLYDLCIVHVYEFYCWACICACVLLPMAAPSAQCLSVTSGSPAKDRCLYFIPPDSEGPVTELRRHDVIQKQRLIANIILLVSQTIFMPVYLKYLTATLLTIHPDT